MVQDGIVLSPETTAASQHEKSRIKCLYSTLAMLSWASRLEYTSRLVPALLTFVESSGLCRLPKHVAGAH